MSLDRIASIGINQFEHLIRLFQELPEHFSKTGISPIALAVLLVYIYLVFRTPSTRPV